VRNYGQGGYAYWERLWDDFVQEELRLAIDIHAKNMFQRVRRIFLFIQRERRRRVRVLDMVLREGLSHIRVVMGRREI
jgi:hypothetical protein